MKKTKLFLTAAAVVVVVGGAFAFTHAQKSHANIYTCVSSECELTEYSTTPFGNLLTLPTSAEYFTGGTQGAACTTTCGSTQILKAYNNPQ
jgi:hypothetical protein